MGPATTFFTTPVPMGMREEEGCCSSPHPSTHQQLWCHPCPHSCPCHGGLTLLQVQSTGCAWKLFPWAGCEAVGRGGKGRCGWDTGSVQAQGLGRQQCQRVSSLPCPTPFKLLREQERRGNSQLPDLCVGYCAQPPLRCSSSWHAASSVSRSQR